MQLRDYQRRTIDDLYAYFEVKSGSPLLVLPTGAGKSVIIAALCKEILGTWPNQRLMILSHVGVLLQQNLEKLVTLWPQAPAGLYCAGLGAQRSRDAITVGSIQSVYKKAHVFGWRDLVLIDEAHLLSNDSGSMYRRFLYGLQETNPRLKVIGLTATPYRMRTGLLTEGQDRLFTDVAAEVTLQELLGGGYISPLVSKASLVQADLSGVRITAGEFNSKDAEAAMDKEALTAAALDEVFRLADDRRSWLFFCAGVNHAEHVRDALRARGVTAECITGATPADERDRIIAAYKAGEIRAITNANVLTTGFDAPNIDLIAVLRPTMSPGLWVQMLGRGLRIAPGKKNCLVLDFTDTTERLGPIDQIRPPKAGAKRGPQERHERSCLICPICRMASPLGAMECAECGHTFARPERIRHDTEASTAAVMAAGTAWTDTDPGEWLDVDKVEYFRHEKEGKTPTLRVEYVCGMLRYKEWICLEHPEGFARGKAVDWWKRRYSGTIPDNIELALFFADTIKKPIRIRVKRDGNYWRIASYDFTGWSLEGAEQNRPAQETGNPEGAGDPIDFLGGAA